MEIFIRSFWIMLVTIISGTAGIAQINCLDNTPIVYGKYRCLHSNVLNEDRVLFVRLPIDYEKSNKRYPVLFKLDGSPIVSLQTFCAVDYLVDMTNKAEDHIVIGVENTNRNRDMDPEGGADKFIQFVNSELIPFIDKKYRTNGFRILCGQSFSSLFAMYCYLNNPDLFDAYILSSFGLYKEGLSKYFENKLKHNCREIIEAVNKCLFVTNGKQDALDPDGSIAERGRMFLDSLKNIVPASVNIKCKYYDDEGHVPFPSIYDGLIWIYSKHKVQ